MYPVTILAVSSVYHFHYYGTYSYYYSYSSDYLFVIIEKGNIEWNTNSSMFKRLQSLGKQFSGFDSLMSVHLVYSYYDYSDYDCYLYC